MSVNSNNKNNNSNSGSWHVPGTEGFSQVGSSDPYFC